MKRSVAVLCATILTVFVLALILGSGTNGAFRSSNPVAISQWPIPPDGGGGGNIAQWPIPPDGGGGGNIAQWPIPPDGGGGGNIAQWPIPPDGGGGGNFWLV